MPVLHVVSQDCRFELDKQLPNSPDLAPSEHCFFSKIKKKPSSSNFDSDNDIIAVVDHFLEVQDTDVNKRMDPCAPQLLD